MADGKSMIEMSQSLGLSSQRAFFKLVLPAARPVIFVGLALVLMETLADFGAVSILGFNTFTTAIYKSWFSMFSLGTAAQLASLLLIFVSLLLILEHRFRSPQTLGGQKNTRATTRILLTGWHSKLAVIYCALVFSLCVLAPLSQLGFWSMQYLSHYLKP